MKVMHIISGLEAGGAESVLAQLVLADSLNQHVVISLHTGGFYGPILNDHGVKVVPLRISKGLSIVRGVMSLHSQLTSEKPDIVQTWMYHADLFGGLVARLAGQKAICWGIHNSNITADALSTTTRLIIKINSVVSRWIPSKIISCSVSAAQIHRDAGFHPGKMTVIPNGYDIEKFRPNNETHKQLRRQLNIPPDCCLLGMIARWHPVKDHNNLFSALSNLQLDQGWQLLLAGDLMTDDNAALIAKLEHYGIRDRCILAGHRKNIADILNALDIHILSSIGEAFPNSVAEAMACGVPCVVTDVGDAALIVDGTGRVVPASNSVALREAISDMIIEVSGKSAMHDKYKLQRQLHFKIADRYSVQAVVDSYRSLWKKVILDTT